MQGQIMPYLQNWLNCKMKRNLFEFISMQIEGFGQTFKKFIDSSDV